MCERKHEGVETGGAGFSLDSVGIHRCRVMNERVIQEGVANHRDLDLCEGAAKERAHLKPWEEDA
jgi:hypothetical protein